MRFVLIHGGFHGAWCWERTVPELQRLGHDAVAIDLPGHGERRDEDSTLANRRDAILDVLEPGDVLVGHSGGGFDITLAADGAPDRVGHLVFLAAGLPIEGETLLVATGGEPSREEGGVSKLMDDETGMSNFVRPDERGWLAPFDFDAVWPFFYHDCDEATARWAFDRLTPAPPGILVEPIHLPRFWDADIPRSYIRCLQDRAKPRALSDETAGRLGVEPLTIDSSHSPFLSRPAELAERLVQAAGTTPVGPLLPG